MTIIASAVEFSKIFDSLERAMDVLFDDGYCMFLAFWDPAVLGSLIGQSDDSTLHVQGPVLNLQQRRRMESFISGWWYWGRGGVMHSIQIEVGGGGIQKIMLDQSQVDALVEASLPDHVLFHVEKNLPVLLGNDEPLMRYQKIQASLKDARELGLTSMADLVNFVCLDLHYGGRLREEPSAVELLSRVKNKEMSFLEAAQNFP